MTTYTVSKRMAQRANPKQGQTILSDTAVALWVLYKDGVRIDSFLKRRSIKKVYPKITYEVL
jgi:hypothetical protein